MEQNHAPLCAAGRKGIALLDHTRGRPRLRYVFDVSDTGARSNSRTVNLWQMREEYLPVVQDALEQTYGVPGETGLEAQLEEIDSQMAVDFWEEHGAQFLDMVPGSYLESYDEYNIGAPFRKAVTMSAAFQLCGRCGGDLTGILEPEDFPDIFEFNTRQTANALGTAVSAISSQVFREIERTIRNYERTRQVERRQKHGRTDLHPERGLPVPESSTAQDRTASAGQVRETALEFSPTEQSDAVQRPGADRESVPASAGDSGDGEQAHGAADERTAGEESRPGQTE